MFEGECYDFDEVESYEMLFISWKIVTLFLGSLFTLIPYDILFC